MAERPPLACEDRDGRGWDLEMGCLVGAGVAGMGEEGEEASGEG